MFSVDKEKVGPFNMCFYLHMAYFQDGMLHVDSVLLSNELWLCDVWVSQATGGVWLQAIVMPHC